MKKVIFAQIITMILALIMGVATIANVVYPIKYQTEVSVAAAEFGLTKAEINAIICAESGFRAKAESRRGAVGLMQIMPATAEMINASINGGGFFDLLDPETNIRFGAYYFSYLKNKFGDFITALAAYNAGEGVVSAWVADKGKIKIDDIPFSETRAYVKKVLLNMRVYTMINR